MLRTLALVLVLAPLPGCLDECVHDVEGAQRSPDGRYELVSYAKSCGGMAGARRGVSLVPAGTAISEATDTRVFYYEDAAGVSVATAGWRANGSIDVAIDPRAQAITKTTVVAGLPVRYRAVEQPALP